MSFVITSDLVRSIAPRCHPVYLEAFDVSSPALIKAGIITPLRSAHFLTQFLHETMGGRVLRENLNYSAGRIVEVFGVGTSAAITRAEASRLANNPKALAERVYGLGNPKPSRVLGNKFPGDGYKYRGNSATQITGGFNHQKASESLGYDFYADPDQMATPKYAIASMIDYWDRNNCNEAADSNDLVKVRRKINGGNNGLEDCKNWFNKVVWPKISKASGTPSNPASTARDNLVIQWYQSSLNQLGYKPELKVDGKLGTATEANIRKFQRDAGVKADGLPGPVTKAALQARIEAIPSAPASAPTGGEGAIAGGSAIAVTGGGVVSKSSEISTALQPLTDAIAPHTDVSQWLLIVFLILSALGVGITIYGILKKARKV